VTAIKQEDLVQSVADALQYISYYHPVDYIRSLAAAYEREESPAAKDAMAQILINSRMCAEGRRPICQDTGIVTVFLEVGHGRALGRLHRFAGGRSTRASAAPTTTRTTSCAPACWPIRPASARTPATTRRPSST
jgi:hypothetical protein